MRETSADTIRLQQAKPKRYFPILKNDTFQPLQVPVKTGDCGGFFVIGLGKTKGIEKGKFTVT